MSILSPRTTQATVKPRPDDRASGNHGSQRGTVPTTMIDLQELIRYNRKESFDRGAVIISHWEHMVKSLQEITTSALSHLASAWTDTRTFGILICATRTTDSAADLYRNQCASSSQTRSQSKTDHTKSGRLSGLRDAALSIPGFVFHPFTKSRIAWDLVGMALCFHDVAMFPAEVFELPESYMRFRAFYEFVACLFWSIDIPINFSTGYISMEGLLEMRKHRVIRHYARSWAVVDFVITCIDWIGLFAKVNNSGVLRMGKAASRTMRSLRLLRLPRLSKSLSVASGANNSEAVMTLAGVAKLLILLILVTHYVACLWHWLADNSDGDPSWHDRFLEAGASQPYQYLTSMHWAITQFTPASMEVVPVNVHERLFTCVVIVVAMVFFSSFVSSITHAMTNLRMIHSRKLEQEMFMAKYFSEFRISRELASRCRHFITQHQKMAQKRMKGTDIPWSKSLPRFIIEDLRCEALMPLLRAHPFFDFYAVICPVGMRQICCLATEEVSMLPQEQMFWGGQPVNRMLFVRVGSVFYKDDNTDIDTLQVKVGEWACEETLWSKVSLVSRPVTASTLGCELITILPSEFQMLARIHPWPLRFCVSYASLFINHFNNASRDPDYRNLLFNDSQEASDRVMKACDGLDENLPDKQSSKYQISQSKTELLKAGQTQMLRRGSRGSRGS